jgi:GYF domain 2
MTQFYLADGTQRRGPFPLEQLPAQGLTADTLVWREGMADWQRAEDVVELRRFLPVPRQFVPQSNAPQPFSPATQSQPLPYHTYNPAVAGPGPGLGIASMVLGICSLVLFCAWYVAIPCAILAVVFGAVSMKNPRAKGFAIAGLTCGLIYCSIVALAIAGIVALFHF